MERVKFVLECPHGVPTSCCECHFFEVMICHLPETRNGELSKRFFKKRCPDCPLVVEVSPDV